VPAREEAWAQLIAEARAQRRALDASSPDWRDLTLSEAAEVAERLYALWGATGSRYWKLGAVDEATQSRLGVAAPICAPLVPTEVWTGCRDLALNSSRYIRAKFEPEVGVRVTEDGLVAMPCVEVADCRFAGWQLPPGGVIADAALQGSMVFGPESEVPDDVRVRVSLDGRVLGEGESSWASAAERLRVLPDGAAATHVATGAMTPLFDVMPGLWEFDFGGLGLVRVTVS